MPIKWTIEPNDINTKIGDKISIKCNAIGNPVPEIIWKKIDDSKLFDNNFI